MGMGIFVVTVAAVMAMGGAHLTAQPSASAPLRFEFKASKTRLDKEEAEKGNKTISTQSWAFKVELKNNNFADLTDLEVRYKIFVRGDDGSSTRSKQDVKIEAGTHTIESIKQNSTIEFVTKPVTLSSSQLDSDYYYTDGSRSKKKDTIYGIWIKVFQNGNEVAQFLTPSSIEGKVSWD